MEEDIREKKLAAYETKKMNRWNGAEAPPWRSMYLEAYWHDLNAWLDKNEPYITFRFGDPKRSSADNNLTPQAAPVKVKRRNVWDEPALYKLLKESVEVGMTHEKLGEQYGVTRQCIDKYVKIAEENHKPKILNPFDIVRKKKPKK